MTVRARAEISWAQSWRVPIEIPTRVGPAMDAIFRAVAGLLLAAVCWVILIPVVFVLATPVALVLAPFGRGSFRENLRGEYRAVWKFWQDRGVLFVPPW